MVHMQRGKGVKQFLWVCCKFPISNDITNILIMLRLYCSSENSTVSNLERNLECA